MRTTKGRASVGSRYTRSVLAAALWLLPAPTAAEVLFVDATAAAGIAFHHRHGGTGEKYPMETMGSVVVFFDYDADGWLDLYFVNSAGPGALYRNKGDGDLDLFVGNYAEFRPALHKPCIRGEGIAVYCGPEAFAPQRDVFYRNDGNGTFTDIADEVGLLPAAAKELGAS